MADLRTELQKIYDSHETLTPELVVTEARAEDHPLHDRFEWDDAVAGEHWRREQAHELIRSVRVVYREATETDEARTVRAFHAVRGPSGHVYEPVEKVREDPLISAMVLRDMEREWRQLQRRYGHFAEFLELVRADLDQKAA